MLPAESPKIQRNPEANRLAASGNSADATGIKR